MTPAPYNQPPYPPSGDTAADACTVTAMAPDPGKTEKGEAITVSSGIVIAGQNNGEALTTKSAAGPGGGPEAFG